MKLTLSPFLPLLLLACASSVSSSGPKSEPGDPVAAQPKSKVEPAEPKVAAMPEGSTSETPATKPPTPNQNATPPAKPQAPAGTARADADGGAQAPAATAQQGTAPANGKTPPLPVVKASPPNQQFAVQVPTVPPTPCPVVPAPVSKIDQHALSGKNLGGAIRVFDKTIDENAIRRYLCYGVGGKHLDVLKFDVICKEEIAKRKAAGEDVSMLVVTDADIDKAVEKSRKDFLLKYPSLDFPTEVGRAYLHLDVYKSALRPSMLFDRTFFPEDPATWPGVTTEAIIGASNGRGFIDDSIENYQQRKKLAEDQHLDEVPPDDPILTDTLRQWVLDALNQFSTVENDQAKLPADTLLIVDGVPIKVDDIWNVIGPHVTWENVSEARRFLTQMAVAEHDVQQHGVLMSQAEFEKDFAPNGQYRDALTAYEMVGMVLQGFPSMQACVQYERIQRSYRKLIKDEIATDAQLMPYLQRANMIAGAAKMDAEVILCSAYDFANSRWKPDGWKSAETKAKDLKQKLDAGADWGDTLELYSDFWDPPMPEVGQKPQFGFVFKGRFGAQTRNQLAGDLMETDYSIFLNGRSLADEIFFDQKGGTISDPLLGPRGYYISRVNSRSPASSGLNLAAKPNRDFLLNYICMARFGAYSRQLLTDALAKGDVKGF
jgi:hypothetical protein